MDRRQPPRRRRKLQPIQQSAQHGRGQVVIGVPELYDVVIETRDTVIELAGDIESMMEETNDLRTQVAALTSRVARVEQWQWKAVGAAGVLGGLVPLLLGRLIS